MTPVMLAWITLRRRPLSASAAVLAVALTLAMTAVLVAALDAPASRVPGTPPVHHAMIGPKGGNLTLLRAAIQLETLPSDVIPRGLIASIAEHFDVEHMVSLHVMGRVGPFPVAGAEPAWLHRPAQAAPPTLVAGRWLSADDEAVLGRRAAEGLGLAPGDLIRVRGAPTVDETRAALRRDPAAAALLRYTPVATPFDPDPERALHHSVFRVVGVLDHGGHVGDSLVLVHPEAAFLHHHQREALGVAREVGVEGATSLIWVRLADPGRLPALRELIDRRSVADIVVLDEALAELEEIALTAVRLAEAVRLVGGLMAALGLWLLVHVRYEVLRSRVPILLALGYTRAAVLAAFAAEALLLCSAAVVVAAGLAEGLGALFPIATGVQAAVIANTGLAFLALPPALLMVAVRLQVLPLRQLLKGV